MVGFNLSAANSDREMPTGAHRAPQESDEASRAEGRMARAIGDAILKPLGE
jgi:hypothetical protein